MYSRRAARYIGAALCLLVGGLILYEQIASLVQIATLATTTLAPAAIVLALGIFLVLLGAFLILEMDTAPTKRVLKILYFAMFCAIAMYWFVMEMIQVEPADVGDTRTILLLAAGITAGAILYMRFSRIPQLLSSLSDNPNQQIERLRMHYILCYVLSVSVALYGFILHILGGSRSETFPFLVGAIILFLLCYPRIPKTVVQSYEWASVQKEESQPPFTCVFHSSPRLQILRAAALAAVAGIGLIAIVMERGVGGPAAIWSLLPLLGAFYLLDMALRPKTTVILNEIVPHSVEGQSDG